MEDNDEFGDLYTDVLRPLTTSFQSQPQPQQQPPPALPPLHLQRQSAELPRTAATSYQGRPIDLNVNRDGDDDEDSFFRAPNSISNHQNATVGSSQPGFGSRPDQRNFDLNRDLGLEAGNSEGLVGVESGSEARVLETKDGNVKVPQRVYESSGLMDEADIDVTVEEMEEKDDDFVVKGENLGDKTKTRGNFLGGSANVENFGVGEKGNKIGEMGLDPMIPGLSIPGVSGGVDNRANANYDDDWDSDSEDDLQIVLNDSNHGPIGMEQMEGGGIGGEEDDEDDEDGEQLVIVVDNDDPSHHQQMIMEEQEWGGEEVGPDGEKKELGDVVKVGGGGGAVVAPKIGYSNHGYHHPFHSQFKYLRPGALPMPGAASMGPGGTPGQVRPPVSMVPVAGRGRGDWRPTVIKGSPAMQKGLHPGYGMPIWGGGASGRGLEFTLPSYKTIFEVDINGFEEKPWRLVGVDITDFFNFDLNEESWKDYCKQLEQLRLETTMQSQIRVYESGRTEQEYDPDLPPELAAAAGLQDILSESAKLGKADAAQNDLARGSALARPPLPTGRAIQVETGYGERLPSIDTRKPRISDLDVIIEIVCQDSSDGDTNPEKEMAKQGDNDPARDDPRDVVELEDFPNEDAKEFDRLPHAYSSSKKEVMGERKPFPNSVCSDMADVNGNFPLTSEAPSGYHPDAREATPVYPGRSFSVSHEERQTKGRARDRSPIIANKESRIEEQLTDNKESSVESLDGRHSPLASPRVVGVAAEQNVEPKDAMNNEIDTTQRGSDMNKEELALNSTPKSDTLTDETGNHAFEKQRVSSQAEQPLPQEIDEGEDSRAARSSENSKARSESSNDWKLRDNIEEEEVQGARSIRMGNLKRSIGGDEDNVRRKLHDERQENERHRTSGKGREDLYYHKGLDPYAVHHSRGKSESIDLQKDIDSTEGARQQREDLHGRRTRAEVTRKREHRDETGSRHRSKVQEIERNEKDEHHHLRKQLENGSWRGNYGKDIGSRHTDKDDNLKSRNENIADLHNKRRKEEAHLRREYAEKEEMLHALRENSSRRKRERDEVSDQRRRDDQVRTRDDDQHSVRYKEEGTFQRERGERQREREEWHKLKQLNEYIVSKKEKGEVRVGMRGGQAAEEKMWGSQSRGKDDHRRSDRDYHSKEAGWQNELLSRRDRPDNESLSQHRGRENLHAHGNQLNNDQRRTRLERASTGNDAAANADNDKVQERKHKEIPRKAKESDGVDCNSLALSKKNQDGISGQISEMVRFKGRVELGNTEYEVHLNNLPSRKHREEASTDDDLSESRRGRSKLERWTSHKERDFSTSTKASSSMKIKKTEAHGSSRPSVGSKLHDEASKLVEDKQHASGNEKDVARLEINNTDKKPIEDRHLDTVEKLKKRSERFKLPMPSEKEATAIKKMENEPLPSSQSENCGDFEIKAERPARKRRWTGN
ncbi:hypothetical protein ACH5RR_006632 [Cinchona calisaya]|uniref:Pre-mRNA polyadenylation factor Fip1 domain-containing protein n=1 Tax=Cinchona calisaya TaxID=153742 RepID=A0ABD3APL2_9GENT